MENPMSFFAGPATWRKREGPKMKYCLKAWFGADLGQIPMFLIWIEHWTKKMVIPWDFLLLIYDIKP